MSKQKVKFWIEEAEVGLLNGINAVGYAYKGDYGMVTFTKATIAGSENATYVRVYDKVNTRMKGGWVMKADVLLD